MLDKNTFVVHRHIEVFVQAYVHHIFNYKLKLCKNMYKNNIVHEEL